MSQEKDGAFSALLDHLHRSRGFDFAGYKAPSLVRRIRHRMEQVGQADYAGYLDYLEVHPEEFTPLLNTILINVTSFFREPDAWRCLADDVLAPMAAAKGSGEPIRVWSAGCSSGEEAYTLAILLADLLGPEAFARQVKIYATDVDEEALAAARQAVYAPAAVKAVPEPYRNRFLEVHNGRMALVPDLRRAVIFGRHDLVQDPPISRLDLLVCRNTLMYLNAETQGRILERFHFALEQTGILFMGKAEMLLTHAGLFNPLNIKHRIFTKTRGGTRRERMLTEVQTGGREASDRLNEHLQLREAALEAGPTAQVMVDLDGVVVQCNARARALFSLSTRDCGRLLQDLDLSYKPVELRSLIERAYGERRPVRQNAVERVFGDGQVQYLDVQVFPLQAESGTPLGACISYEDVSERVRLQMELQRSSADLERAYESLQSAHEELETTNEELQSTNEELETTNEELQSTNEELETMNEELQSTNEEQESLNTELRRRTEELNTTSAFLQSVLAGLRSAVMAVDGQFRILLWNPRAEDMWGLREDEVMGKGLFQLDIGIPLNELPLSSFLAGKATFHEMDLEATNRRGRAVTCRVTLTPLLGAGGGREGVVLLLDEVQSDTSESEAGR